MFISLLNFRFLRNCREIINKSNIKHQKINLLAIKAYIFDKLTSSVNDVRCSNAVVSEFMNKL